jgi:hypothetical protein
MGNVINWEGLEERRRERQRAKIIAELERQANAQLGSSKGVLSSLLRNSSVAHCDRFQRRHSYRGQDSCRFSGQLSLETGGRKRSEQIKVRHRRTPSEY